ncbi:unnamed protein product [Echinostoma caproni]|uniref:DNA-directed RNA polymerase n=1 Tax=Echinostoma caproni TaxID=27848 RepID=A0A183B734_9TREM|nr:unnamed protein product [Echinostoma caproni]
MTIPECKYAVDTEVVWAQIGAPEFMLEDPVAFLALLESRFHEARVTGQLSRYHKLLPTIQRVFITEQHVFLTKGNTSSAGVGSTLGVEAEHLLLDGIPVKSQLCALRLGGVSVGQQVRNEAPMLVGGIGLCTDRLQYN